jgi:hypothetical protein
MEQLEWLGGAPLCSSREWVTLMLADDTGVVESLRLIQDRETTDESLPAHLAEGAKVCVPEAHVPTPRVLFRVGS